MEQRRGRSYSQVYVLKKQKQTGDSAVFYLKSSILAQVIDIKMNLNQLKR